MRVSPTSTVNMKTNDTNVLDWCYTIELWHTTVHIWIDVELSSNNTRRYIRILKLIDQLDPIILHVLPGLHAFTGEDFTEPFNSKWKPKVRNRLVWWWTDATQSQPDLLGENYSVIASKDDEDAEMLPGNHCTIMINQTLRMMIMIIIIIMYI